MTAVLLLAALVASCLGFACLALAMPRHWSDLSGELVDASPQRPLLRRLGFGLLALALIFCLWRDGGSFGSVLWVLQLVLSAFVVALILAWRPAWLMPLMRGVSGLADRR